MPNDQTTKARHPCAGLSRRAVEVFEAIAVNQQTGYAPRTIAALLQRSLIQQVGEREVMRDRFGAMMAPEYAVPIDVHMQWCEWCAQNVKDEM